MNTFSQQKKCYRLSEHQSRTATGRSPVPLIRLSVAMDGLGLLQLLPRRFWPRKVFMSRRSVIRAQQNPTTRSLHAYDRKEGSGLRSHASILKSVTCRGAPTAAAAARQTLPSHSGSNGGVCCGAPWVSGRVRSRLYCIWDVPCDLARLSTSRSERSGRPRA